MSDFRADDYRLTSPNLQPAPVPEGGTVSHSRSHAGVVSFLSSHEREGRWEVPRHFRALAVMGNIELDLRGAEVGYGVSVIEAVAVMGNIEVVVPPEISVECDGDALVGTFTLKYKGKTSPEMASRDRVIRVIGTAYLGAVSVEVKGPDRKFLDRLSRTFGMEQE
jgi:hypothetical protein